MACAPGRRPPHRRRRSAAFRVTVELPREDFAMNYVQVVQSGMAAIGTTLRVGIDLQARISG
ncbi:hypothetical protein SLINC_8335 [Streptomyces lincolnensis]|uniref:Uncharacterized protein n=1 Tax=Streptomyces lincolnensis TaxID=1915 RepID=A0A1B1MPM5_STRLN|nr:hypothetical protein SLINC_8335 [Streptomyces lincolnensis]